MMGLRLFTKHPNQVGMTYIQHLVFALNLARMLLVCVICSLIHAFFPFLFTTYTSTIIRKLHNEFEKRYYHGQRQDLP